MDEIRDNEELYYFLARKAEELEGLLANFDDGTLWLSAFNAIIAEINDSKIKNRIAPKMEKLVLVSAKGVEEKKIEAGKIIDEIKEQIFLVKRRLTSLFSLQDSRDILYFDRWQIINECEFMRDGKKLRLQPQLAKVFAFIVQLKPDDNGAVKFNVTELMKILEMDVDKNNLGRIYTIVSKIKADISKFYDGKRPIDGERRSSSLTHTYKFQP